MSAFTKCAGLLAGLSTVAVIGVAVAQSVPPNPSISGDPMAAAGQQSTHDTPMGETGMLAKSDEMAIATITREPEVAQVAPAPEPVAPEPVAAAPEPAPTTATMGAAPEPQPEPQLMAKADRG